MEENDDEEKEAINIEFTEYKTDPENDESATDFWCSGVEGIDEEHITKANLIENLKSKLTRKFTPNK